MKKRVLVTGATGFVGRALLERLRIDGRYAPCGIRRPGSAAMPEGVCSAEIPGLDLPVDWGPILTGTHVVVHLAARVHVMKETETNPLALFRKTNVNGTLQLAAAAAEQGVRRFVFISTIKVNGEETRPNRPFRANDIPAPQDPYAISKLEAERGLLDIANRTPMEVVILRPPLVYGPGVGANFARLVATIRRGVPLPLASVTRNRRSLLALDNLVDLITVCMTHPAAANQVFLASDGEDLSTAELIHRLARALKCPARLLPCPTWVLETGGRLLGRGAAVRRLVRSLQVDISETRRHLDWQPRVTVAEGIAAAVENTPHD